MPERTQGLLQAAQLERKKGPQHAHICPPLLQVTAHLQVITLHGTSPLLGFTIAAHHVQSLAPSQTQNPLSQGWGGSNPPLTCPSRDHHTGGGWGLLLGISEGWTRVFLSRSGERGAWIANQKTSVPWGAGDLPPQGHPGPPTPGHRAQHTRCRVSNLLWGPMHAALPPHQGPALLAAGCPHTTRARPFAAGTPAPHATGTNSVGPPLEGEATQILQLELLQRSPQCRASSPSWQLPQHTWLSPTTAGPGICTFTGWAPRNPGWTTPAAPLTSPRSRLLWVRSTLQHSAVGKAPRGGAPADHRLLHPG